MKTLVLANFKAVEVCINEQDYLQALGLLNDQLGIACEMGPEVEL